jgi:hypothetical protein
MRMTRSALLVAAITLVVPALAQAVPAAAAPGTAASWHLVKAVSSTDFAEFSAVASWSSSGAWAFSDAGSADEPHAYQQDGSSWVRRSFPGEPGESIWSATASSASNVWVFTVTSASKERVLRYNGHAWSVVPTSGKLINSGLALSSSDVWVFGSTFGPSTGTVHYNGHSWTRYGTGAGLFGGSALSPDSIWAYGLNKVGHWNGSRWTTTSVARLLSTGCGNPGYLTGIHAISAQDVVAVGAGGCSENGGPLVLLRYNGVRWERLRLSKTIAANPVTVIGDGAFGVWIPVISGAPPASSMYHLAGHTLAKVSLPVSSRHLDLNAAAIGAGTAHALAVGLSRTSGDTKSIAVILRFAT